MLQSTLADIRFGIRQLKSNPGFTAIAILSLALGIGANTAIFQLVETLRLKTLPVDKPEELVLLDFAPGSARSGWNSSRSDRLTYTQWDQIRAQQQSCKRVMAWSATRFNLANSGEARYAEGMYVSDDFFGTLGVKPVIGRTLTAGDDSKSCGNPGVVISHAFWQREFGGDVSVLGRTVSLNGHPLPVIGVTPEAFFGVEVGRRYDVAVPLCADALMSGDTPRAPLRHAWWLTMMGRLKPGWSAQRAQVQIETASPGIMQATLPPVYKADLRKRYLANKLAVTEAATGISTLRRYERPLSLLMAITGLVLLSACANLANLLLARAAAREREVAVRLAIGASRWRLIRQFLAESLILAVAGAGMGALLAQTLSHGLVRFISTPGAPLFVELSLDWSVLGFTAGLAVTTCLLFGLLPAIRATGLAPASAMRGGGRSVTAGPERFSLRRTLVTTQVALSLVLLVGALLFVRSLKNLLTLDPGFKAEGIIALDVNFRKGAYSKERRITLYRELQDRFSACPGVVSAAPLWFTPMSNAGMDDDIGVDNAPAAGSGKLAYFNHVGPGYFKTMGTALIAGRDFNERDTLSSSQVSIVNETFARKYFGTTAVIGRTFHREADAGKPEPLLQIVGVVGNTKYYELREEFKPIAFFPITQDNPGPSATYVLRVAGSPFEVMRAVKLSIAELSPSAGIQFRSLSTQLQNSLLRERLMATLSGGFAILAVLLATLGLYGVIAYMVARRRNEIGVRIALGADRSRVIRLVMRETLLLLGVGLAVGVVLSLWAARAAATLLYGLQPSDPLSIVAAAAFLSVSAWIASYAPARRAAGLEPMQALRED